MKYVVLGSNSFSGSHLVDELLSNPSNKVVGISRSPEKSALYLPYKAHQADKVEFLQCHIVREFDRLIRLLDDIEPECIVNYVALTEVYQSQLTPVEYFETNTLAVVKLCEQLRTRNYLKHYIHISSAEVYGPCDSVAESTPPRPTTAYAVSKAAADAYLLTLFKHYRFPAIIIRSTNVYGPGQQLYKIIPRAIIRLKLGQGVELHDGGRFVRPFIHIRDACRGVIAAIDRGRHGDIYNFSALHNSSIRGVVKLICFKMAKSFAESTYSVPERTGYDRGYSLDYSKAVKELGWQPQINFEEGVDEVIDWIERNWEEVLKEPQVYTHKV